MGQKPEIGQSKLRRYQQIMPKGNCNDCKVVHFKWKAALKRLWSSTVNYLTAMRPSERIAILAHAKS